MLARGWFTYPVTSMHSHLPPKSGCICQHIPRFANPMAPTQTQSPCKQLLQPLFGGRLVLQQLTPGRQANLGLQLSNRSSAVAYIIGSRIVIEKIAPPGAMYHKKTAEERFNILARGWLAYPVTPTHHPPTAEERLYKRHPSVCKPNDSHTNAITLQITYPTALRRLPHPSKKTPSSTDCANYPFPIFPTTPYLFFRQKH